MNFNLPTTLTLLRIAAIPIIALIFYLPMETARLWCTVVFVIAAITDGVDGYLARKLDMQTPFGAFLDPVADKLMVVIVLVLIVQADPEVYLAIPAAIIIAREVTVASLREWMAEVGQGAKIQVSWIGKCKTTSQMIALICLLYQSDIAWIPVRILGVIAIYVAAVLTIWSMWQYLQIALPEFEKNNEK